LNLSSKTAIKEILKRYQKHPRKKWGQNFLADKNILHKIIDLTGLNEKDYVIEIGPGIGVLSREIALRCKGVLAIEIDPSMQEVLSETMADFDNFSLTIADVLKVRSEQELYRAFKLNQAEPYKVCANIPYNITTPIIFKLLEESPHLEYAVLMMQKEVAARIKAAPGSKDYGLLTVMIQYYAEVEYLTDISRNCFFPIPEVDSALIKITPHTCRRQLVNEEGFKSLVRRAFQMRRKTVLNICSAEFAEEKETVRRYLESMGIDSNRRPETLTLEDFVSLAENWLGPKAEQN
jgi:16S rRNA (adenine1518-N6/adenine1519-N6)-dimethyltransferase